MPGDYSIRNPLYAQLVQRVSYNDAFKATSIPASTTLSIFTNGVTVPVPMGYAARLLRLTGNVSDGNGTGFIKVQTASIQVQIPNGTIVAAYAAPTSGVVVQGTGLSWTAYDDELYLWTDYAELGGIGKVGGVNPPGLTIFVSAEVSNTDGAAAHDADCGGNTYLVEFYTYSTK